LCYIGKDPETPAKATGVSDRTVRTMKENLKRIPSLKWQYFGNEHGTFYGYPGFPGCGLDTYDPRFRHNRCYINFVIKHFVMYLIVIFYFKFALFVKLL